MLEPDSPFSNLSLAFDGEEVESDKHIDIKYASEHLSFSDRNLSTQKESATNGRNKKRLNNRHWQYPYITLSLLSFIHLAAVKAVKSRKNEFMNLKSKKLSSIYCMV